jgi:tetratricopeptide (TPR) repeat protein
MIAKTVQDIHGLMNLVQHQPAPSKQHTGFISTVALLRRQAFSQALEQINFLLEREPENPKFRTMKACLLIRVGDHHSALTLFEAVLTSHPCYHMAQLNYGHALKSVGRIAESIAAYQSAIGVSPGMGDAYWSLARLKTFRFSDEDITAMRAALITRSGNADNQSHLLFALARALEDREQYDESFRYYRLGNTIRRDKHRYNSDKNRDSTARQLRTCTSDLFTRNAGYGCPARDPIFIVGLPRSGSTLLEQILASHCAVEGTAELPDIIALSRSLGGREHEHQATRYPEILTELSSQKLRELGESYLASTRIQRGNLPFFIDKMPNNFLHIGLIHLILPNAKIIDARRHPMANCFSAYKQLFAQGQTFTYDLTDVGHYYRNYVKVMDHWDEVLPGRVLRVQYEELVADPETHIRRLLNYCELSFEDQCLRFYETERAVRTPSAEQVRQPIYTEGLEQWRHFEAHLAPLKDALGPLLQRYPIR